MPALNFYSRFADQVASGAKRQSIRLRQFHPGAQLHMFTGLRTRSARRLAVATVTRAKHVVIDYVRYEPSITLDGLALAPKAMECFAQADGFKGLDEFMDFFADHYDLPLQAWVVEWALVPAGVEQAEAEGVAA